MRLGWRRSGACAAGSGLVVIVTVSLPPTSPRSRLLSAGPGDDVVLGGTGNDRVRSAGGTKDNVDCGPGRDSASLDALDRQRRCERVTRVPLLTLTSGSAGDPLQRLAGRRQPAL